MAEQSTPIDATARFSSRVDDYVRYRPDYPAALLGWLQHEHGVDSHWHVADMGAGTGISCKMFLDAGFDVTAVEPNDAMRGAAEQWLHDYGKFVATKGTAAATGLSDASVDLITVAQAFHWFDEQLVRREFARILRPGGLVAIWWNSRRLAGTPFLAGYEALLLKYSSEYGRVAERYADDARMRAWFGAGFRGSAHFDHGQQLDFDALRGRLMSSSYAPLAGHAQHESMLRALRDLFDNCAQQGTASFDYDTRIFVGELA
ncbi:MAG: class I SAM-dependent methyltransferase [Rhodanobacter sp.]